MYFTLTATTARNMNCSCRGHGTKNMSFAFPLYDALVPYKDTMYDAFVLHDAFAPLILAIAQTLQLILGQLQKVHSELQEHR